MSIPLYNEMATADFARNEVSIHRPPNRKKVNIVSDFTSDDIENFIDWKYQNSEEFVPEDIEYIRPMKRKRQRDSEEHPDMANHFIYDPEKVRDECTGYWDYLQNFGNEFYPGYTTYYVVITPYGNRRGMTFPEVLTHIRKRWPSVRTFIGYEDRDSAGNRINPHYNIVVTTRKRLRSSNTHNLNMEAQVLFSYGDVKRVIYYSFKTYITPVKRPVYLMVNYYVWLK